MEGNSIHNKYREIQSVMGKFAMLILGHYLNRKGMEIEILDNDVVSSINQSIHLWASNNFADSESNFIRFICFAFKIPLDSFKSDIMIKIKEINIDFTLWLNKFTEINKIKFPYVFTFFNVLIYKYFNSEELGNDTDFNNCITRTRDNIYTMMIMEHNENDELMLFEKPKDSYNEITIQTLRDTIINDFCE